VGSWCARGLPPRSSGVWGRRRRSGLLNCRLGFLQSGRKRVRQLGVDTISILYKILSVCVDSGGAAGAAGCRRRPCAWTGFTLTRAGGPYTKTRSRADVDAAAARVLSARRAPRGAGVVPRSRDHHVLL
jgi:hypothetical protein